MIGDQGQHVVEPSLGIDLVKLGDLHQRQHDRGALAATIRSREQPRFAAECNPAQLAFGRIVAQADSTVAEEAREDADALEHVIHGLGHFIVARELIPLPFHLID